VIDNILVLYIIPNMSVHQVVIDTNVFVSALRSRRGASYKLFMLIGSGKFEINISVSLILEYEDAAKDLMGETPLSEGDIEGILDYICAAAKHRKVFYLWRPLLRDPKDDMVLELAVSANCDCIVTYNKGHFRDAEHFGLGVFTPKEFLEEIGEL